MIASDYSWARWLLERGIASIYVVAFAAAALQFKGLLGTSGMLPIPAFLRTHPFRTAPSVFHLHYSDRFFAMVCWSGATLAAAMVLGLGDAVPLWAAMALWLVLWAAYLSIVNVGQLWYSFGWESLLLEAGFLTVFLGNDDVAPPWAVLVAAWWLLFRVEFGAGLIKVRGDECWRNLTCLDYHHETQPMPGPLSWFFHRLPKPLHRVEVAGNHVAQLVVPFGLFAPQPVAAVAAGIVIVTQLWLVASGNFAWLNWLTIVLAFSAVDDGAVAAVTGLSPPEHTGAMPVWFGAIVVAFAVLVAVLSWRPARNLLSRRQRMNKTFDPLHLVNAYGAFGTVGRTRNEVVFEGTTDADPVDEAAWVEYGFKGKPGDVTRMPRQWSPYHLRLDWLLWFAAISPSYAQPWIGRFCEGLLRNDPDIVRLLGRNPFPDEPPRYVRALLYRYRFTTAHERRIERAWWHRDLVGTFLAPLDLHELDRMRR
jgi:hypothetical protein